MSEDEAKQVFEGVPLNRRTFVKRLIAGAFAVPAIVTFSETGVSEASVHAPPHGHDPHHPSPTTTLPSTTPAPTTTIFNTTTPAPTTTLLNTTTQAPTTTIFNTTTPAPTTTRAG